MRFAISLESEERQAAFFAAVTFFAVFYYNLTPLVSIDCWWHMKFAQYLLQHGCPVIYDPFAIQAGKILATYPDALSGTLMLGVYEAGGFLGLNILRIFLFTSFIVTLGLLVRKGWTGYSVLLQLGLLAIAMAGRIIMQPDLFNYILFTLWIYLLEEIVEGGDNANRSFFWLLVIELAWVNIHPLFFYYGLLVAEAYLCWAVLAKWRLRSSLRDWKPSAVRLCSYAIAVGLIWLVNPLGWRALESLFVNMIDSGYNPYSMRGTLTWLAYVNIYCYVVIFLLTFLDWPWKFQLSGLKKVIRISAIVFLALPSILYERSLPFLAIYLIFLQGRDRLEASPGYARRARAFMVLAVALSLLLMADKYFLLVNAFSETFGLHVLSGSNKNLGVADISPIEPIREMNILNQLVPEGNCMTNDLRIGSCAVWHCPDKPFFMYGHAAVVNKRWRREAFVLGHFHSDEAERFLEEYDIRTVVLLEMNEEYMKNPQNFNRFLRLIYMDPVMAVFTRRGVSSEAQDARLRDFYSRFRPGVLDAQKFSQKDQILQYFLLWFSAEMTGADGDYYLSIASRHLQPDNLRQLEERVRPFIEEVVAEKTRSRRAF